jgi:hypothetical protein
MRHKEFQLKLIQTIGNIYKDIADTLAYYMHILHDNSESQTHREVGTESYGSWAEKISNKVIGFYALRWPGCLE